MKRKVLSILLTLVLVLSLCLVTATPVAAADREILNQTRLAKVGSATIEWSTNPDFVYSGDYSAHGVVPANSDFFNVVHMDIGDGTPITLGDITSIQFMEFVVSAGGVSDLSAAVILFLNDPSTDPPVEGVASWWEGALDDGITFHNNGDSAPVGAWSVRDLSDSAQNWEGYADSVGTGTVMPLSYWTDTWEHADWEVVFVSIAVGDGEWAGYEGYIDNVMVTTAGGTDTYLTEPRIVNIDQENGYNYIQDAIDDAGVDNTISVEAGTYAECLDVYKSVSIVGVGVSLVTINTSGLEVNNAGIYVSADNVLLQGFTQVGNPAASTPNYGIKFGVVSGGSVVGVLARDNYRTGFDFLGTTDTTVSNIESRDNGGHGIQLCDSTDIALSDITIGVNGWEGVNVATWGKNTPLGTSGIVFSGTNSFGDFFQIEEGDFNNQGVAPSGEAIITYSTNLADGADVTVQDSDFGYAIHGDQDDGPGQNRVWFFKTLAEAQAEASSPPFGHFNGIGVYVESLTDRTQLYVSPGCEIQVAIDAANPAGGDTISVAAGTYNEGLIDIDKSITISGDPLDKPVILPTEDTVHANHRGWFQITGATTVVDFKNLEFDGSGKNIENAIRYQEGPTGTVENCDFSNMSWDTYVGFAVVYVDYTAMGGGSALDIDPDGYVKGCTFTNIKRVGVSVFGVDKVYLQNNTFTGKGDGDWLDYGIEVGGGGVATIEQNNTITNCTGVASVDGSTSAGILVTTYYGAGTQATITGNTLSGNTGGIAVGYDATDTSVVVAHNNNIVGNTSYGIDSTAPSVDATKNWWGTAIKSQIADLVSDNVDYSPWLDAAHPSGKSTFVDVTSISLESGWNLISLPLIPEVPAIEMVLAGADAAAVNKVAYYTGGSEGSWLYYSAPETSDLNLMNDGKGYWMDMNAAGELIVEGWELVAVTDPPSVPPSYDVVEGWNLIGFKSLTTDNTVTTYLGLAVIGTMEAMYGYDAAAGLYKTILADTELVPGQGYWLAVNADGIIYPY